jgi:hypothetical protein
MALRNPGGPLDPEQFVVVPNVAAVDEFQMTNDDGSFAANVNEEFIDRLCAHMNDREAATGDLAPLVIGHTADGEREVDAPPLVGFARNWRKGVLGSTGRKAAYADFWVYRNEVERVRRFPRRSCEVWPNRYEVDPISLLGATTPARDLGLLRLSRDGASVRIDSPGELTVPDPITKTIDDKGGAGPKPPADPSNGGAAKGEDGKLDQILALLTKLVGTAGADPAAGAAPPGAPPAAGAPPCAPPGDADMGDADYDKMLAELMGEGGGEPGAAPPAGGSPDAAAGIDPAASRKGDDKVQNSAGAPGGSNTVVPNPADDVRVKLSRVEAENADLRGIVTKMQIKGSLQKLREVERVDVNPDDDALVADLAAMPPDVRARQMDRIKLQRPLPGRDSFHLSRAVASAAPAAGGKKRIDSRETQLRLSRKAATEGKTFEQVATAEGYDLS